MSKEKDKKQSNKKSNKKVTDADIVTETKDTKANKSNVKEEKVTKEIEIIEEEFDYNEDLDEVIEDFEEEEIIVEKVEKVEKVSKQDKTSNKKDEDNDSIRIEKVPSKKKIEEIQKIAKAKKKKTINKNSKLHQFIVLFEKHHVAIYSFVGGVLLATLIAFIIWPDRIATLKSGEQSIVKVDKKNYTADDLYEDMKNYYSVSLLLDSIDKNILNKLYPETDEMMDEVEASAQNYFDMYKQYYNYTEEQFLEQNGFSSYEAFLEYLKLDHRRNKYLDEYIEKNLKDKEIKEYYEENVFGDINTQHILVEVSSGEDDKEGLKDEDAKKLAEKIITKLNDGTSWEDVQKKYKDKITFEDLGYQSWDASLEESFMTALEDMDDESYSEEPVKTSYGYHVIYRLDQKKKPSLKDAKKKVIDNLIADAKADDANLLYKALISLREDKNIKFNDTVMKDKYKEYCKQYKK